MKKYFYLLLIVPLMFSCAEKVKTCKITSSSIGSFPTTYKYNGDHLESINDWNSNGQTLASYDLFTYTDQKIQIDHYTAQGQFDYRYDAMFNTNGKIGSVSTIYDTNHDGYPEDLLYYTDITYKSGHLDSLAIYIYQTASVLSYKYQWTGDNLTSFQAFYDGSLTGTASITYDDTPNPYYSMQAEMTAMYNDNYLYTLSKNNVTHFLYYDEVSMSYTSDDTYINVLDADGNTSSHGGYYFTYECTEK